MMRKNLKVRFDVDELRNVANWQKPGGMNPALNRQVSRLNRYKTLKASLR